jgi:O-antigen/teichoic acid export membrane protein
MLYLWIDFVMLSLMTSAEVVGWYGVPTRLFQTLMFLPVVVSTAWLPRFVRGFESGAASLARTARQPLELVLLLSLPIAAMTAIVARPLIHLLYGSAYAHAVPVMALLGLSIPPMYLNIMLSQVLVAMNRQSAWTWVMVVTTVINPLLNLALIPLTQDRFGNGAIGAAIALFLTELLVVSIGVVLVGRGVFDRSTLRRTVLVTATALAMWGAAVLVRRAVGDVASVAAGIAVFFVLAYALKLFTPEEIGLLRSGFERVGRKLPRRRSSRAAADALTPSSPRSDP